MEQLWAPWRMRYVSAVSGPPPACIFCAALAADDDAQALVVSRGKLAGIAGKPRVMYPRHRFSLRDLLSNRLGLDGAAALLPALPSLRTPLYLMP